MMRIGWTWLILTEKRLFRKPGYLLVLLLVPILVGILTVTAGGETGMMTVGLCCEEEGGLSEKILEEIQGDSGILRFLIFSSRQEAILAVENGTVSTAWIFPEKLEQKLERMAKQGRITAVMEVIEREDDITLVFAREVLCSYLYPRLAYETYREYVKQNSNEELSEESIRKVFEARELKGNLFEARHLDGTTVRDDGILLAPVRGLLAIWLVVCGLSAILFYQKDLSDGVYDVVPLKKRAFYAAGLELVVLMNGGIVFLVTLNYMGVLEKPGQEIMELVLLLCCIGCFCLCLGVLLNKMERLGAMIPILILIMLVACPVFVNVRLAYGLQGILPIYYYLTSFGVGDVIWKMAGYIGIGACLFLGMNYIRCKWGRE